MKNHRMEFAIRVPREAGETTNRWIVEVGLPWIPATGMHINIDYVTFEVVGVAFLVGSKSFRVSCQLIEANRTDGRGQIISTLTYQEVAAELRRFAAAYP